MDEVRLKPGKYYQLSKKLTIRCICGVHLVGPDKYVWIIEKKEKASPRARSKWSLDFFKQDQAYKAEQISKEKWSEF